jgi:hypothetical protein
LNTPRDQPAVDQNGNEMTADQYKKHAAVKRALMRARLRIKN